MEKVLTCLLEKTRKHCMPHYGKRKTICCKCHKEKDALSTEKRHSYPGEEMFLEIRYCDFQRSAVDKKRYLVNTVEDQSPEDWIMSTDPPH